MLSDDYGYSNEDGNTWRPDSESSEWWNKGRGEQQITDMIEDDFQKAYFYIATKMMWDFIFSAVGPNEKELCGVIDSILMAGSEQVISQYNDVFSRTADGMDSQTRGMLYLAKRRAEHHFAKLFKEPIVQPTMLGWLRGKFKKGIKK